MNPHGNYIIEVVDDIVHVFPSGGFNALGIEELHQDIVLKAPINRPWALFEHPRDLAGLTPEAIEALINSYQKFATANCVVAALEISSVWKGVFDSFIVDKVDFPIYLDSNITYLENEIRAKLKNSY